MEIDKVNIDDKDNLLDSMHSTPHQLKGGLRAEGLFNKKSKTDKPLVSVITVVLNGEKYLEQTIQSVVNQTYDNIEYIIIDGGSTDGTLDIIRKYEDKITYWVSEKDEGISDALNKGIKLSSGEIIGMIHSDDYYTGKDVICKIVNEFNKYQNIKAIYGIIDFVDPKTNELELRWGKDCSPNAIRKRMYIPHPTLFCKKEVYENIGYFRKDLKYAMDYEWAIRLVKYTRPYFLNERIAVMRRGEINMRSIKKAFLEASKSLWGNGYYVDAIMMIIGSNIKDALEKVVRKLRLNIVIKKYHNIKKY